MKNLEARLYIGLFLVVQMASVAAAPVENPDAVPADKPDAAQPLNKFTASVGLGIENSNNIFLSQINPQSDNIFHETLSLNYARNSPTVKTKFLFNADHQRYQKNSFPDQNVFSSALDFNATLIKKRLTWDVFNQFARVPTNNAKLNLPTNQENTNTFTTGPTYIVFRNARQYLNLSLKYNKLYTQKSDIDSSSYSGNAVYNRNLTRTFAVKLEVNAKKRNFVNTVLNTDYRRTDAIVALTKRMKLSELYVATGKTRIVRKGDTNVDNGIFRMGYKYALPNFSSLSVSYDRELSDFTGEFSNASSQSGEILPNVGSQIFIMQRGNVAIKRDFGKSNVGFNFTYYNAEYDNSSLNSTTKASELFYDEKITSSVNMRLTGAYDINTYNISSRKDKTEIYTGMLSKQIAGLYLITLKLQFTRRKSDFATFSSNERRIAINGQYFFN